MKKLMFLSLLAASFVAGAAELKIGTVDMYKLIRNHPSYENNKKILENTDRDHQRNLDKIKSSGEKLQAEGRKIAEQLKNPMISDQKKREVEEELMGIQQKLIGIEQEYRSAAMNAQDNLRNLESNLLKAQSDDIKKSISKFATAKGYDFILDQTAAPFSKKSHDVTNGVLQTMGVDPKTAKGEEEDNKNESK